MNPSPENRRLWWRLAALFFVVSGALCFVGGKPGQPGPFSPLSIAGMVLMVIGVALRFKARRNV